jgi:hypothetical protein
VCALSFWGLTAQFCKFLGFSTKAFSPTTQKPAMVNNPGRLPLSTPVEKPAFCRSKIQPPAGNGGLQIQPVG